jgi:hypothetical protein
MPLYDIWLNIPQAVVLEATGDLERARGIESRDPLLLVIKAARLLPPLVVAPVKAGASRAETRRAFRKLIEEVDSRTARGCYDGALRRVHSKLRQGVTIKGSRAPNLPLEVVDNAEFARLELRGTNAVDPRTGQAIWHDVLINARELIEANLGDPSFSELHPRRAKSDGTGHAGGTAQVGLSTKRAAPVSDRDLRSWFEKRVSELSGRGKTSSGEADWEAAKEQFLGRVTRARLRTMRDQFAPADWKKQGRRATERAK